MNTQIPPDVSISPLPQHTPPPTLVAIRDAIGWLVRKIDPAQHTRYSGEVRDILSAPHVEQALLDSVVMRY